MLRESLLALSLLGGANAADVASTQAVLHAGGAEAWNPGLYGPRAERIVPMKLAITAAEFGTFKLLRKKHKHAAWLWVAGVVAGNVVVVLHNRNVERRLRR
jgi:hypothetical protein